MWIRLNPISHRSGKKFNLGKLPHITEAELVGVSTCVAVSLLEIYLLIGLLLRAVTPFLTFRHSSTEKEGKKKPSYE